jgi:hypothetical protein
MRTHVDLLGWFHVVWGLVGLLAGGSLGILAAGSAAALDDPSAARALIWLFASSGLVLVALGAANVVAGRAILRRRPAGRSLALALGVPNLVVVPFGTALGIYTYRVLLADAGRRSLSPV